MHRYNSQHQSTQVSFLCETFIITFQTYATRRGHNKAIYTWDMWLRDSDTKGLFVLWNWDPNSKSFWNQKVCRAIPIVPNRP